MESTSSLKQLRIDLIEPNPENPRIIFRQEEMDSLLISIKKYGVQVPISVYRAGSRFVLIDGERRWRTCKKLNFQTIPAIVQSQPNQLDNLLMMFNIHALREQWDLFTIGNKITRVIELLTKKMGHDPKESELSEETGLTRSTIRRCRLLIELPERFKTTIMKELEKPKSKQKLTEDFFIEMESALKTVRRNYPDIIENRIDGIRDNLIEKYQKGIIKNIVDFRKVSKLTTAPKNVDYPVNDAKKALAKIFMDKNSGIDEIFNSTVGGLYDEKKMMSNLNIALYYIKGLSEDEREDEEVKKALKELKDAIELILDGEL